MMRADQRHRDGVEIKIIDTGKQVAKTAREFKGLSRSSRPPPGTSSRSLRWTGCPSDGSATGPVFFGTGTKRFLATYARAAHVQEIERSRRRRIEKGSPEAAQRPPSRAPGRPARA
jgi:hypothetical protein